MRIGVLTFHRAYNYGASLQAYALVVALCQLGADAHIVDYRSPALEDTARLVKEGESFSPKLLAKVAFRLLKHRRFDAFDQRRIPMSVKASDEFELASLARGLDAVIVGSDQVWNDDITKADSAFYLDFVKGDGKRFSYAASFGGIAGKAEGIIFKHRHDLESFAAISLRESDGKDAFETEFSGKVRCDIDPVLLIDGDAWSGIASPRLLREPYLFMYLVGDECNIRKFAKSYASQHGLRVVDNKASFEFLKRNGPEDFLSWILNADTVVTNSFHGTAFSILFEKNAYYELGEGISRNRRAANLLDLVGVNGREIFDSHAVSGKDVNWASVRSKLDRLRAESNAYLSGIVSRCGTVGE